MSCSTGVSALTETGMCSCDREKGTKALRELYIGKCRHGLKVNGDF